MKYLFLLITLFTLSMAQNWNAPHSKEKMRENILFTSFNLRFKHLDPVESYSKRESVIISNIYEPVVGYNYLKRPYVLEPLTLKEMPKIIYLDKNKKEVSEESKEVAFSQYTFKLQENILYQNHPCFVKKGERLFYDNLTRDDVDDIETPYDLKKQATRKLKAQDYVYAIKRMAVRQNHSPILDIMQEYIVGLKEFSETISK